MIDTFVGFSDIQTSKNINFAPQNVKEFAGLCLTIVFAAIIIFPVCIQATYSCFTAEIFLLM